MSNPRSRVSGFPHDFDERFCAEDVHQWFALSYANYQVIHRSLAQSMPAEWQHRFQTLMEEMRDYFQGVEVEPPGGYRVLALDERNRFTRDPVPPYNRGRTRIAKRKAMAS